MEYPTHEQEIQSTPFSFGGLLSSLNDDILIRIFKHSASIHAPTIDRLGQTCKKMYLMAGNQNVWNHMAINANVRPRDQLPILGLSIYSNFRQFFLLRPRIRTDGIYISKITYFRPGLSDTSFNNPVHLVTYYRYLRFFGPVHGYSVWWLVSSKAPLEVIDTLRHPIAESDIKSVTTGPTANIFYGRYRRSSTDEQVFELELRDVGNPNGVQWYMAIQTGKPSKISPVRHGILKCLKYIPLTCEPFEVNMDTWKNFVFSKVRSYYT